MQDGDDHSPCSGIAGAEQSFIGAVHQAGAIDVGYGLPVPVIGAHVEEGEGGGLGGGEADGDGDGGGGHGEGPFPAAQPRGGYAPSCAVGDGQ